MDQIEKDCFSRFMRHVDVLTRLAVERAYTNSQGDLLERIRRSTLEELLSDHCTDAIAEQLLSLPNDASSALVLEMERFCATSGEHLSLLDAAGCISSVLHDRCGSGLSECCRYALCRLNKVVLTLGQHG